MAWYRALLKNHVLANLTFVLVLVVGTLSYLALPRQQDPTINFNWIIVTTILPGASATDVEKKVTDPLEDALRKLVEQQQRQQRQAAALTIPVKREVRPRPLYKRWWLWTAVGAVAAGAAAGLAVGLTRPTDSVPDDVPIFRRQP